VSIANSLPAQQTGPSQVHRFSEHTTARVGGAAGSWITADTKEQAIEVLARHPLPSWEERQAGRDTLLVLGGGSNLLVADSGFSGTVLHVMTRGIEVVSEDREHAVVAVAAGHPWDDVVAWAVEREYAGLEALSGIPGSTGATPVQNVGAYGAEVSHTLVDVEAWDRHSGALLTLSAEELDFDYRNSLLKRSTVSGSPRYVVLCVRFRLEHRGDRTLSAPVRYGELARSLGLTPNAAEDARRAPVADVRDHVLRLRAGKGMVLDAQDHDTWSTGSFFTNPVVPEDIAARLPEGAPRFPAGTDEAGQQRVKLSAAWLIDQAGCGKGFGLSADSPAADSEGPSRPAAEPHRLHDEGSDSAGLPAGGRAGLSTKHTLAVTNRGGASTEDLLTVARAVRDRVLDRFGIELHPEPVLVGCTL
jgi:UDP-N-acetylmuramate dehydrogenase